MWWCKRNAAWGRLARLAVVLAAAGLTAGCFQPLYGTQPSAATDSVRDKLRADRRAGDPGAERPAGGAHRGGAAQFPAIRLERRRRRQCADLYAQGHRRACRRCRSSSTSPAAGRTRRSLPSMASYQLIEIATGKTVLSDSDLCPCRLRHSRRGATLRQAARASAMPKTAPPRSSPTPSGTGWHRTSSPAPRA